MSQIWEALRSAERHRAGSKRRGHGATKPVPKDRRRDDRAPLHVSLFVYGHGANEEPFHEETKSLRVNSYGALLTLATHVIPGQRLLLTNKSTKQERECRVVYIGHRVMERLDVGVAFVHPAPGFWQS